MFSCVLYGSVSGTWPFSVVALECVPVVLLSIRCLTAQISVEGQVGDLIGSVFINRYAFSKKQSFVEKAVFLGAMF